MSGSELSDGSPSVAAEDFDQKHNDVVLAETWWWAVHLSLSAIALVANLIFLVTVIYNRSVSEWVQIESDGWCRVYVFQ